MKPLHPTEIDPHRVHTWFMWNYYVKPPTPVVLSDNPAPLVQLPSEHPSWFGVRFLLKAGYWVEKWGRN